MILRMSEPMHSALWLVVSGLAAGLLGGPPAEAAGPGVLRAARSENGRFELRVEPARRGQERPCRATLMQRGGAGATGEHVVWQAELVNETGPVHGFIRDDGRFVITLDEYRRGGAAHALVIYGENGEKHAELELPQLLSGPDWRQVRARRGSIEWLRGAKFSFEADGSQFVIRLHWEREIRVDLERGEVIGRPANAADEELPAEVLAALAEAEAGEGGDELTQEELAELSPEELAELIAQSDPQHDAAGHATIQEVLDQAMSEALDESVPPSLEAALDRIRQQYAQELAGEAQALAEEAAPSFPPAGISDSVGVPVPQPDPADPVDYLAWANEHTQTVGPSAEWLYEAAAASLVPFDGDEELLNAAMAGDPDALLSPEVTAYLEANAAAVATARAALALDYRGITLHSEGGPMFGVLLPNLGKMREIARLTTMQGELAEANGDMAAATSAFVDTLAFGAHQGQGTTLIENLVGVAIQNLGSERLLDSLASAGDGQLDYVALAQRVERSYAPVRPITQNIQFERAMLLDSIQRSFEMNPQTGHYRVSEQGVRHMNDVLGMGGDNPAGEIMFMTYLGAAGFEEMTQSVNQHYDRLTEAAALPYQEGRQAYDDLEQLASDPIWRATNPLLATLTPSLSRVSFFSARAEATRRGTILVTQLKAYRQQHGRYPDSLGELVNSGGNEQLVIDPFTNAPFAYIPGEEDFTLYSLGANGVDDGGQHDAKAESGDVRYWPRR